MEQLQKFSKIKNIFPNIFVNSSIFHRQFLLYNLRKKWSEIMGKLAEHCYPLNIQDERLIIGVDSASLTNRLYIMRIELLEKINYSFCGEIKFSNLSFVACSSLKNLSYFENNENESEENFSDEPKIICPKCGGKMESWRDVCFSCYQEQQREKTSKLRIDLLKTPWLKCEDESLDERVFFNRTKENLAEIYYEKIRLQIASDEEKILAVLFYTGKKPEEISKEIFQQTLKILSKKEEIKE